MGLKRYDPSGGPAGALWLGVAIVLGIGVAAGAQDSVDALNQQMHQASEVVQAYRRALDILVEASIDPRAQLRANAVEALQPVPRRVLPVTQRALGDRNEAVRFAGAVTAGMLKFDSLTGAIRPLLADPSPSVRAAARYTLYQLGQEVDLTPLARILMGPDATARANSAMLLGMMGDRSAVPLLQQASQAPLPARISGNQAAVIRMQIAEAMVKLGADSELNAIRAGAYSNLDEVRVLAITAMGEVADRRMVPALQRFLGRPPLEIQLAAAGALARMGEYDGRLIVLEASQMQTVPMEQLGDEQARRLAGAVRSQAAWAMGWFSGEPTMSRLIQMLDDPDELVRVSAAAAVVRRVQAMRLDN
jgi:HEAT repeat protein